MVGTIYRGMAIWEIGRSEVVGEGEPEMERSREDFAGTGFRRKARASFCHDLALALEITMKVYLKVAI